MSDDLSTDPAEVPRKGFARFAHSRSSVVLMCVLSFTDACVSPIIPEVVLVPLVLSRPRRAYLYAFLVSLASVVGGVCGYLLGMFAWDAGVDRFFFDYVPGVTPERFETVSQGFGGQAFWVMFAAGFTPLPYKLFTVAAGVCYQHVGFGTFLVASILSRFLRFYLTVWLLRQFGQRVLDRVSRNLAKLFLLAILIVVLVLLWVEIR